MATIPDPAGDSQDYYDFMEIIKLYITNTSSIPDDMKAGWLTRCSEIYKILRENLQYSVEVAKIGTKVYMIGFAETKGDISEAESLSRMAAQLYRQLTTSDNPVFQGYGAGQYEAFIIKACRRMLVVDKQKAIDGLREDFNRLHQQRLQRQTEEKKREEERLRKEEQLRKEAEEQLRKEEEEKKKEEERLRKEAEDLLRKEAEERLRKEVEEQLRKEEEEKKKKEEEEERLRKEAEDTKKKEEEGRLARAKELAAQLALLSGNATIGDILNKLDKAIDLTTGGSNTEGSKTDESKRDESRKDESRKDESNESEEIKKKEAELAAAVEKMKQTEKEFETAKANKYPSLDPKAKAAFTRDWNRKINKARNEVTKLERFLGKNSTRKRRVSADDGPSRPKKRTKPSGTDGNGTDDEEDDDDVAWLSVDEVCRTHPELLAIDVSKPFDIKSKPLVNYADKPRELNQLLHLIGHRSACNNNLRSLVRGWFLQHQQSEKSKFGTEKWMEVLRLVSESEFLSPDIRAILMSDHDTQRFRFYLSVVDSFVQIVGRHLRNAIKKSNDQKAKFLQLAADPNGPFPGYAIPKEIPDPNGAPVRIFIFVIDPDVVGPMKALALPMERSSANSSLWEYATELRVDLFPKYSLEQVVRHVYEKTGRMSRQAFGLTDKVVPAYRGRDANYPTEAIYTAADFSEWLDSRRTELERSGAHIWMKIILQRTKGADTPPHASQKCWTQSFEEWSNDDHFVLRLRSEVKNTELDKIEKKKSTFPFRPVPDPSGVDPSKPRTIHRRLSEELDFSL